MDLKSEGLNLKQKILPLPLRAKGGGGINSYAPPKQSFFAPLMELRWEGLYLKPPAPFMGQRGKHNQAVRALTPPNHKKKSCMPLNIYVIDLKVSVTCLTLVLIGGGVNRPRFFLFIVILKSSLLDHTPRPTCKFLILAIFYHAKKILKI